MGRRALVLIVALVLSPTLKAALVNVRPLDPGVFAGAAVSAILMVTVASVIPALAVTRVDPRESINAN